MILFKENSTGGDAKYPTHFSFYIDDKAFHASFISEKSTLESFSSEYNSELWRGNVCEVFIDVGHPSQYWELEVAPNGTMFLAEVTRVEDRTYLRMLPETFANAEVKLKHEDNSYSVDIEIPLEKMQYNPRYGLKLNAFRIEMEGETQYRMALNPTLSQTFHDLNAFLDYLHR